METRRLPVELTNAEKLLRGEQLARLHAEADDVEATRKAQQTSAKGKLEALEAQARDLANVIRTGREYRDIEVRERRNDTALAMELYRLDTGEVVETRPLRPDELQTTIFDISKGKGKKSGSGGIGEA